MRSHRVASGLVGGLALLTIAACTPIEEIPDETATASPSPTAPPAVPAPAPAASGAPFAEPVVAPASPGIEGLVPVVNPVERLKQIRSGRTDPFASTQTVGIQVSVTQPPEPLVPPVPPPDGGGTAPTPPPFPTPGTPGFPGAPGGVSPFPTAPPGPQPDLARAVEVTGVVQVGDVPRAIIQAPNEATSRYVVAGQRVANGRVLVKHIEANQFPSPVVILEEHGIEVIKAVGETAETAETAG
ncbi:hypothetical protein [Trichothermofontia sp.]